MAHVLPSLHPNFRWTRAEVHSVKSRNNDDEVAYSSWVLKHPQEDNQAPRTPRTPQPFYFLLERSIQKPASKGWEGQEGER